jgi:hypothetical protein
MNLCVCVLRLPQPPATFDRSDCRIFLSFLQVTNMIDPITLRILVTGGSSILAYPQFREGVCLLGGDARSTLNSLSDFADWLLTGRDGTSAPILPTTAIPPTPTIHTSVTQITEMVWIINEMFGAAARIQSLLSAATLATEIYKAYQAEQIKKELKGISEQIKIYNNLVAGGSAGPDGFAQHVLDFIKVKIEAYTSDGKEHRFFLYHPDTQWHGAFRRIRHAQRFSHCSL